MAVIWANDRSTLKLDHLTFAEAGEQMRVGDTSRSRLPTGNRDEFVAERLHPILANRRCRPKGAGGGFLSERPVYLGT